MISTLKGSYVGRKELFDAFSVGSLAMERGVALASLFYPRAIIFVTFGDRSIL
jgi:hypothetical protein